MKNISRRTALKLIGGGVLALAGAGLWHRDEIVRFLDNDAREVKEKGTDLLVKKRPYYETELSILGFGAMRFPTKGVDIDEELAEKMIDYAYRHGVNYYDTAYIYHLGNSEGFLGRVLAKYPRESYYLVDKMPTFMVFSPSDVPEIFEKQLKRCGVEYFDNYMLHSLTSKSEFEKVYIAGGGLDYLKEQQAKGRIKHLGFSYHGEYPFYEELMENYKWDFVMIQLNYADWNDENEAPSGSKQGGSLYRKAVEKNVPVFVMEPVKGGNLANVTPEQAEIFRRQHEDWSPASWAIRYVASFPQVVTLLSGMSDINQVIDNVNTMSEFEPLTDVEQRTIALAQGKAVQGTINCTYCRYCDPCPYGVDIAGNFRAYNEWAERLGVAEGEGTKENKKLFLQKYKNYVVKLARANHCISCGVCLPKCPQSLQIPSELAKVSKLVKKFSLEVGMGEIV